MGQVWREELEIDDLEATVFELYDEIRPLYLMLHAVVRHKLLMKYGPLVIDPVGPIPIHVLGQYQFFFYNLTDLVQIRQHVGTRLVEFNRFIRARGRFD